MFSSTKLILCEECRVWHLDHAADLRVENERLQAEISDLLNDIVGWNGTINTARQIAEQLEAEVERLRAELRTCQETLTACLEST